MDPQYHGAAEGNLHDRSAVLGAKKRTLYHLKISVLAYSVFNPPTANYRAREAVSSTHRLALLPSRAASVGQDKNRDRNSPISHVADRHSYNADLSCWPSRWGAADGQPYGAGRQMAENPLPGRETITTRCQRPVKGIRERWRCSTAEDRSRMKRTHRGYGRG
jgi:hypothetical protein